MWTRKRAKLWWLGDGVLRGSVLDLSLEGSVEVCQLAEQTRRKGIPDRGQHVHRHRDGRVVRGIQVVMCCTERERGGRRW